MHMINRMGRGFTLIELLVVIAIIAVLAGILMPVISSTQEKARQAKCSSNLMQLSTALGAYKADWGRYPFRPFYDANLNEYQGGVSAVAPDYIKSSTVLECPNDAGNIRGKQIPKHYSTYNGPVHFMFDSTATGTDMWQFEKVAGGMGTASDLCMITYNYGGFDNNGWDESWWDGTKWTMSTPDGGAVPTWLDPAKWRFYPRLSNRQCPDNAVALHCRAHRAWYGRDETKGANAEPARWRDIVVRINGRVETVDYSGWAHPEASGASQWKIQK